MEKILVVPRTGLFAAHTLQGFSTDPALLAHFLNQIAAHGCFVPRWPAEDDETLKQVVPYGIVRCGERVFAFRRGTQGQEAGLRGRWSVGLGGHVNPEDGEAIGPAMLETALLRELDEEVALDRPRPEQWGVLNDDDDPVGRRHFGFAYHVWVASPTAVSREPGKIEGSFEALSQMRARGAGLETWSRIVLEALVRNLTWLPQVSVL